MEKEAHVVSRSDTLQNVYCCGIVGSYGGGDSNQVARQYLVLSVPFPTSQSALGSKLVHMKEEIWKHTVAAFEQERARGGERIVRIPETLVHKDSIEWDLALQISSHLKGVPHYNMMFQGWLFHEDVKEEGRLGVSQWPLIGLYDPVNCCAIDTSEPAAIGINDLRFADQHVHLVEEVLELDGFQIPLSDWHFGSDMARFHISPDQPFARAWAVCMDLEKGRCQICYLLIIKDEGVGKLVGEYVKAKGEGDLSGVVEGVLAILEGVEGIKPLLAELVDLMPQKITVHNEEREKEAKEEIEEMKIDDDDEKETSIGGE